VGVERVFPINSPRIEKVEIVRLGKVRRAKLYYIRTKIGKKSKVKILLPNRKEATAETAQK
jgi:large subunit ribosomal protein L19